MFKRLNTGGAILAPQEIRNCSARMIGTMGDNFYSFLKDCANLPQFKACTETLSQSDYDKKGDEELVLRFFATKNSSHTFKGSVRDWLDTYMEQVLLEEIKFNFDEETKELSNLFEYLANSLGSGAFVKYRGESPVGALAPAYYEAVSIGVWRALKANPEINPDTVRLCVIQTVQTEEFRSNTGPGANSKEKLEGRISAIERVIGEAHRA